MGSSKNIKIRVLHTNYGCDTGCCGHILEMERPDGKYEELCFQFTHPYGDDFKEWATEFAQKSIKSEYPECYDSIDWESLEYKDVSDN